MEHIFTEEDVRTKIIFPFLLNCGIDVDSVYLEKTIKVQLGHTERALRGRADVLVKNKAGKNLLIFEVKGPKHKITSKDIDQGLSYGRLVCGNITPVVVVTNGTEFIILDTISGDVIKSLDKISFNNNRYVAPKLLADLQQEALSLLLIQSETHLFETFFKEQVSRRLLPLCGRIGEDKKYVAELYVPLTNDLTSLEHFGDKSIFLVTGKPQTGKTNYLCHNVSLLDKDGCFCLFYSAYRLNAGICDAIQADFNKHYGLIYLDHHHVLKQLCKTKKVYLFIDGLNEVTTKLRHQIVAELASYIDLNVVVIASCTTAKKQSVEKDENRNPTIFGETSLKPNRHSIIINAKSTETISALYAVYAKAFKVNVPKDHIKVGDPYLLRLAMEIYKNGCMPSFIDAKVVIERSVAEKTAFIDSKLSINSYKLLADLAMRIVSSVNYVSESEFCHMFNYSKYDRCPDIFITQGILDKTSNSTANIDFYYDSTRDFFISEHYFEQNSFESAVKQLIQLENKSVVNSVIYSYMTKNDMSYDSLAKLAPQHINPIIEASAAMFIDKINTNKFELKHYLDCCEQFYVNTGFDNGAFGVAFDSLLDKESEIHLNECSLQFARVIGLYIEKYGFDAISDKLSSEQLYDFNPPGLRDCLCFYQALGVIVCRQFYEEGPNLIIELADSYKITKGFAINLSNVSVLHQMIDDIFDNYFNYIDGYCATSSYLDMITEDFHRDEIEDYIQSMIELNEILGGSKNSPKIASTIQALSDVLWPRANM
jgi:hypothetical protein